MEPQGCSQGVPEESTQSESNLDDDSVAHTNQNDSSYYGSEEWQQDIDAAQHISCASAITTIPVVV